MKILYIILTCKKYAETRQRWQRESWLRDVEYIYLDDTCHDRFADRYIAFFSTYTGTHDWLFFCDDDTFVFDERLRTLLGAFDSTHPTQIGFRIGDFMIYNTGIKTTLCSGGAGISLSRGMVVAICEMGWSVAIKTPESDTSLAVWCKMAYPEFTTVAANRWFCPTNPRYKDVKQDCITYHYCDQNDFMTLKNKL